MKHFIEVTALLILVSSIVLAQFIKGNVQLSLTGSAGTFTNIISTNYTGYGSYSESNSSSSNYVMLVFACGIFFTDEFSIEPELGC
jgi:hypothetical protein